MSPPKVWLGVGPVTSMGPGLWVDTDGNIHVATGEVLHHLGAQDTPKNRQLVREHIAKQWAQGPAIPVLAGKG